MQASADDISKDKNIVIQQLREMANEDQYCGQSSIIDRKLSPDSGKMVSTYAVATNIVQYNGLLHSNPSDESELTEKVNVGREKVNVDNGIDISTISVPSKKLRSELTKKVNRGWDKVDFDDGVASKKVRVH